MQDDTKAKGLQGVLNSHWEKIALGGAIVLMAVMVAMASKPAEQLGQLEKQITAVRRQETTANAKIKAPAAVPGDRAESTPPAAENVTAFAASVRTDFNPELKIDAALIKEQIGMYSGRMEDPVSSPDGIELTWTISLTSLPKEVKEKSRRVPTHFNVQRRAGAAPKWEDIGKVDVTFDPLKDRDKDPVQLKFTDRKILPKMEYSYRVLPDSDKKDWTTYDPVKQMRLPVKESNVVSAKTQGIWKIGFTNPVRGDEDKNEPSKVWVSIEKYDPEFGLVKVQRNHVPGDKIGTWPDADPPATPAPTPLHNASSPKLGKSVKVDFDTKCVLKHIRFDRKINYTYERCKTKATSVGTDCEGKETVPASYVTTEVEYTDDEGKPQQEHIGGYREKDQLCEEHGGPKKPVLTEEQRAAKHKAEALDLLKEANELWEKLQGKDNKKLKEAEVKANRKKAQPKYRDLLKDYLDVEEIKAAETKIKERAAADVDKDKIRSE